MECTDLQQNVNLYSQNNFLGKILLTKQLSRKDSTHKKTFSKRFYSQNNFLEKILLTKWLSHKSMHKKSPARKTSKIKSRTFTKQALT